MKQVLWVIFLISNVWFSLQQPTKVSQLPAPRMKYNTPEHTSNTTYLLFYSWYPVESSDDNPVLGYKVKVWTPKETKTKFISERIGDTTVLREVKDVDILNSEYLDYDPIIIKDVPANTTSVRFDGLNINVTYLYRAQAYNAAGDGPLSSPFALIMHSIITTSTSNHV